MTEEQLIVTRNGEERWKQIAISVNRIANDKKLIGWMIHTSANNHGGINKQVFIEDLIKFKQDVIQLSELLKDFTTNDLE
jgi:hypothetical protein